MGLKEADMKCFTFSKGELTTGFLVSHHDRGAVVRLGERGENKRFEDVALFRPNPAEIDGGGVIHEAHPVSITDRKSGRTFVTLATPNNKRDRRVLVRLKNVEWQSFLGDATELVFGWTVQETNYSYDTLLMLKPGAVIRVRAKDRPDDGADAIVLMDDELKVMKFRKFLDLSRHEELEAVAQSFGNTVRQPERSLSARLGGS